jgi:hypothetical protein
MRSGMEIIFCCSRVIAIRESLSLPMIAVMVSSRRGILKHFGFDVVRNRTSGKAIERPLR